MRVSGKSRENATILLHIFQLPDYNLLPGRQQTRFREKLNRIMMTIGDLEAKNAKALTVNNSTSYSKDIKTSRGHSQHTAMDKPGNRNSNEIQPDTDAIAGNNEANLSLRLQTSQCSSLSNESDLSLALERDLDCLSSDWDELPVFEIRELSPIGRTPSPIDSCNYNDLDNDMQTPTRTSSLAELTHMHMQHPYQGNPNFVALHDIDAQISPPSDGGGHDCDEDEGTLSRNSSLETIFEGIFLDTPTRLKINSKSDSKLNARHTPNRSQSRSRVNLLEKVAMNRLQAGKENQTPTQLDGNKATQQQLDYEKRATSLTQQSRQSLADVVELSL